MNDFNERVLAWLRISDPKAESVVSVRGEGSDWAGDTEGGFFSVFTVSITYTSRGSARTQYLTVEGQDMESLWNAVVA